MFLSEAVLFSIALGNNAVLLFLLVYYVITLSDLECDYMNAVECCNKLNFWVPVKLYAHAFLTVLLTIHGHWILALLSLPLLLWLLREKLSLNAGSMGIYDPTEIHNRDRIANHMRDVLVYLCYYLLFFFVYLYCFIIALLKGDPIERHHDETIITEL